MMEENYSRLIYNRIKLAYDIKTDQKLADFMGINQSTLSQTISRNAIIWDRIMEKCEYLSIDWLITGSGEMFRNSSKNTQEKTDSTKYYEEINSYLLKKLKETEEELNQLKDAKDSDDVQDVDRGSYKKTQN